MHDRCRRTGRTGFRRTSRVIAAAIVVAFLATIASATAHAGSYWVHSCRTPDGGPAGLDGWVLDATSQETVSTGSACPRGSAWLRLNAGVEHPSGQEARGTFQAPPDTRIAEYRLYRTFSSTGAGAAYYNHQEDRAGVKTLVDRCWGADGCVAHGSTTVPFARADLASVTGLELRVGCYTDSGAACPPAGDRSVELRMHRADIRLEDVYPPAFTASPGGPWLEGGRRLAGTQSITLAGSDRGGGLSEVQLEVDGSIVQTAALDDGSGRCARPYIRAAPCPLATGATIPFDTARLDDGVHRLRILLADAAGNATPWGPVTIRTDNRSCVPRPAAPGLHMTASFHRRAKTRRATVRYGRRVVISGRLRHADGSPVAGAPICLAARRQGGKVARDITGPVTDQHGRFATVIPRGPSRTIWVVHRTDGGAAAKRLRLTVRPRVRARPSARSLRNGQRVLVRGRISGPVPKRGARVELQVDFGTHWQTFKSTRTRRDRSFAASYRFRRTFGVARFRMRVLVPEQAGYPYATGVSRPFAVTVRG